MPERHQNPPAREQAAHEREQRAAIGRERVQGNPAVFSHANTEGLCSGGCIEGLGKAVQHELDSGAIVYGIHVGKENGQIPYLCQVENLRILFYSRPG